MPGLIEKSSAENEKHEGDVTSVVYSSGHVFSGGADGKIKVWDKDLSLLKTIDAHEAYIYALAVNSKGKLYSSSCDGSIKFIEDPINSSDVKELLRCQDEVETLVCVKDVLYCGDDKGVVCMWENDRISFKFNLVEQVKSLAIEKNSIYTAREMDAVMSDIMEGKSGKYSTKSIIPGRAPLTLMGPIVEDRRNFLAFCTRDGKGVTVCDNITGKSHRVLVTKEDCHEMIINAICGTENHLFTGGWDGNVKRWTLADNSIKLEAEVSIGSCINFMCPGDANTLYTASSDGIVRKIVFT